MSTTEQKRAVNRRNKRERNNRARIAGRKPLRDAEYLAWLRSLPCVCCAIPFGNWLGAVLTWGRYVLALGDLQQHYNLGGPTEAAHVGARGLRQKCSDREAIPLCREHHQHGYPESHHTLGKLFWKHHGIDREALIAALQAAYAERAA